MTVINGIEMDDGVDEAAALRPITPEDVTQEADRNYDLGRKHGHGEKADLLDWAETLLCNSLPMSHCCQEEWDAIIKNWRDQKHGVASAPNELADKLARECAEKLFTLSADTIDGKVKFGDATELRCAAETLAADIMLTAELLAVARAGLELENHVRSVTPAAHSGTMSYLHTFNMAAKTLRAKLKERNLEL